MDVGSYAMVLGAVNYRGKPDGQFADRLIMANDPFRYFCAQHWRRLVQLPATNDAWERVAHRRHRS
jgi:hypothetical protein